MHCDFTYDVGTGEMFDDALEPIGTGYSGFGNHKNDRSAECLKGLGPIPMGHYLIGMAYTSVSKGPVCMKLIPLGHSACGRTGFLIHGDSRRSPGKASRGCIVIERDVRDEIATCVRHNARPSILNVI